ncbi:hypothetical protein MDA_GLEAN10007460 [Myotis davidii]|uniref:Uncharacterized protein n=1 Tax=Myotis davidii TaxID=225400 RepID=L5M3J5_MYODS|nr:hypothetical protein MDA_GLEAN10007460 [Myotis davidii]
MKESGVNLPRLEVSGKEGTLPFNVFQPWVFVSPTAIEEVSGFALQSIGGGYSTGSSTRSPGVRLLTMMCTDHQEVVRNMVGVGNTELAVDGSGGAADLDGP